MLSYAASLLLALGAALAGLALGHRMARRRAARNEEAALVQQRQSLELEHQRVQAQAGEQRAAQLQAVSMQREAAQRDAKHFADRCDELAAELVELRGRYERCSDERVELLTRLEEERRARDEGQQLLAAQLEQLTQRIFEEKTAKFAQSSQRLVEGTLSPLREQLGEFKRRVEEVYDKEAQGRAALASEVRALKELNRTMSEQALRLTQALRGSSKARGAWGEVVLERVLQASGLRRGHEYETQRTLTTEDGRVLRPDVIVHLPDGRHVIVDSKVSLVDYERYCAGLGEEAHRAAAAADPEAVEEARKQALRAHVASVRGHIRELASKDYPRLPGLRSPDFVLMFVPIEAAYLLAFEGDEELLDESARRRVAVVGPSSLLPTLWAIATLWRFERQSQNMIEIARMGGAVVDKIALVLESFAAVGEHMKGAQRAYEQTAERLSTGRGSLAHKARTLMELGAKEPKKGPRRSRQSRTELLRGQEPEPEHEPEHEPDLAEPEPDPAPEPGFADAAVHALRPTIPGEIKSA